MTFDTKEAFMFDRWDDCEFEGQMVLQRVANIGHWTKTLRKLGHLAGHKADHYRELMFRDFGDARRR